MIYHLALARRAPTWYRPGRDLAAHSRRDFLMVRAGAIEPARDFFPAHKTAFAAGGAGPGLPLHTQHALHTFSSLRRTLPCRPPNPDTISRLFSPPFPTFRRSLSLRPVGGRAIIGSSLAHRRWLLEAGCSLTRAMKPRVAVWRWRGWGSRTHSPAG